MTISIHPFFRKNSPARGLAWLLFSLAALLGLGAGLLSVLAPSVTVEWSTGSELESAGFNVYRSLEQENGYEQINPTLIPAAGDVLSGSQYTYIDRDVQFGGRYFYLLEEVDAEGTGKKFSPSLVENAGLSGGIHSGLLFLAGLAGLGLLIFVSRGLKTTDER